MKKSLRKSLIVVPLLLVLAVLIVAVAGLRLWLTGGGETAATAGPIEFRVKAGDSPRKVAGALKQQGLLHHERIFLIGARLTGGDRRIKAGLYAVPAGASPSELLAVLVSGSTVPVRLTLPEGLTAEEIATQVQTVFKISSGSFLAAADSIASLEIPEAVTTVTGLRRDTGYHPCEGYLWPETYHFDEGSSAAEIARTMIDHALQSHDELIRDLGPSGMDRHQTFILASIVEAETPLDEEKPKVAAVYSNRLRVGKPLEADPTIAYMLDKKGQRILYADLEIVSGFNTYQNAGLPPGPIANPGRAALAAAMQPLDDFPALYFVADGRGGHVFSRTFEEHSEAVERYRRMRGR
jgi:peptidoglycan lytic transglycosylase G